MNARKRAALLLAVAILSLFASLGIALPEKASAVSLCTQSGTFGGPTVYNRGPRDPNTIRKAGQAPSYTYVPYGTGVGQFCLNAVYVHAGYDIRVLCQNGVYWWIRDYGWQAFRSDCAGTGPTSIKGSSWINLYEYKQ